jgi:hypothetical protein
MPSSKISCRGHYELGLDAVPRHRLAAAFAELTFVV